MCSACLLFFLFFFSSRRRHTRLVSDWSSDVCSSDLGSIPRSTSFPADGRRDAMKGNNPALGLFILRVVVGVVFLMHGRSEERRVGKECRSRWSRYHYKKKEDRREGANVEVTKSYNIT